MTKLYVHPDISMAQTLQKEFYLSLDYFDQSKEKIFANTWQWLANDILPLNTGQCVPVELLTGFLDDHLLLTCDPQGHHHCISNVCTHRGSLLADQPCTTAFIKCPYHGRQFHLDGKFKSMPEFKEVKNFPSEDDHLQSLPLQSFAGNHFTRLSGDLSFELFFGPMLQRMQSMPIDKFVFQPGLSKSYNVPVHWALYCENYLEGFHIPFVHPALNQALDFGNYRTELFEYSSLQVGIAKEGEDCFDLPASSPYNGQQVAAFYWFIFPNIMFNFYPWGLSVNVVQPKGVRSTTVHFLSFVWDENKLNRGAGADVDTTELEDEDIVQRVQAGISSRFYKHGRYSVKQEQGTHHFHRLIAKTMQA